MVVTQIKVTWEIICVCLKIRNPSQNDTMYEIVLLSQIMNTFLNSICITQALKYNRKIMMSQGDNSNHLVLAEINQGYVLYLPNQKNNTQVRTCK